MRINSAKLFLLRRKYTSDLEYLQQKKKGRWRVLYQ